MNRIDSIFADLRRAGKPALMPFICGGHPTLAATRDTLHALGRAGASIIEIGIPFSDPIADGPVIAAAMHRALQAGVTPDGVLAQVREARAQGLKQGVVAMVSVSIVHRMGERELVRRCAEAGFDGLIFPDLPVDDSGSLVDAVREAGLIASFLVAPTTPPARAQAIVSACSGFVYLLARVGITGDHADTKGPDVDYTALQARIAQLRTMTNLPIACGFGISTPDAVGRVVRAPANGGAGADAAIVGSALVKRITRAAEAGEDPVEEAESFTRALAAGCRA